MAVVADAPSGRVHLTPTHLDILTAQSAESLTLVQDARDDFLSGATPTRAMITGGVCSTYGLETWADLFTSRQLVVLTSFCNLVREVRECVKRHALSAGMVDDEVGVDAGGDGAVAYADSVATYLGLAVSKETAFLSTQSRWRTGENKSSPAFGRQAFPMVWDFAEIND